MRRGQATDTSAPRQALSSAGNGARDPLALSRCRIADTVRRTKAGGVGARFLS